jgi:hypothetical protein
MEHCGSAWRLLIYDVTDLRTQSQVEAKRAKANCIKDKDGGIAH